MTDTEVAARFESLGGGQVSGGGWGFGCEFGFYQREAGCEPLDFLRWASINPDGLTDGLMSCFYGIESEDNISLRIIGDEWGATQTTYGIRFDHIGLDCRLTPEADARKKMAKRLARSRDRLLEDLAANDKIFVYRTYDQNIPADKQTAIAACMRTYGKSTVCCVLRADSEHPPFTAERKSDALIVAYIDRFAPMDGHIRYNNEGWGNVCRAVLRHAQ